MDEKLDAIKDLLRQFFSEMAEAALKGRDAAAVVDRYARAIEGVHRYYEGAVCSRK